MWHCYRHSLSWLVRKQHWQCSGVACQKANTNGQLGTGKRQMNFGKMRWRQLGGPLKAAELSSWHPSLMHRGRYHTIQQQARKHVKLS